MRRQLVVFLSLFLWAGPAAAFLMISIQGAPPRVTLSNSSYTSGVASGTVIGAIGVTLAGSFTVSLSGSASADFSLSSATLPSNLITNNNTPTCPSVSATYKINIIAMRSGVSGSPFTQPETITCNPPNTITGITLASNDYNSGAASGADLGAISVQTTGTAFSGTLALSGADAADFSINPANNHLVANIILVARPYNFTVTATQSGAVGSPFAQPETIIDALADPTIGYTYTYNANTGACVTNDPSGSCNSITPILATNTAAQNDTATATLASEAQRHTRPAVTGPPSYAGGYNGANNAYQYASKNNLIILNIPANASAYQYTNNFWWANVPRLEMIGAGGLNASTKLQNTVTSSSYAQAADLRFNYDWISTFEVGAFNNGGYFIQTAAAGATSVTLTQNPSNATSQFCVGCWIAILSYDQQFQGYPPNFRFVDVAQVTGLNGSTGVISFTQPLTYTHVGLPNGYTNTTVTNPYCNGACSNTTAPTDGPSGTIGPARVVPIDTPSHPAQTFVQMSGIDFLTNPNWTLAGQITNECVQSAGQIDIALIDILEGQGMCTTMSRGENIANSQWQGDESDKELVFLDFDNDRITYEDISHAGQMHFIARGGHISNTTSGLFNGNNYNALNIDFEGTLLDALLNNPSNFVSSIYLGNNAYGWTNSLTVNGVEFLGSNQVNQTNNAPINASTRTGATVTIDNSSTVLIKNSGTELQTAKSTLTTIGSAAWFLVSECGAGAGFYHNGTLVGGGANVTSITGDGTNVYIQFNFGTSGQTFATNDTVYCAQTNSVTVTNSTGVKTGYTWTDGNMIRYPGGQSIPSITTSGNSGN